MLGNALITGTKRQIICLLEISSILVLTALSTAVVHINLVLADRDVIEDQKILYREIVLKSKSVSQSAPVAAWDQ